MNFIKNKDVKRASYYVWFLGAKESKGLRGDEYVQPVLNYLIDNECDLEPSKVTLQVSSKGLKIIQILTIPRKSGKLNPDQQLQLFVATTGKSDTTIPSSVMKSEQVKHHIPHDSISWVYQEDDVICAILLLYNPITRCPVHIHGYRCDSIQTANNLRQQLQTLIDRPENQKKFREIEMRLAAKGLLIPPMQPQPCGPLQLAPLPLPPSNCHHPSSLFDDCSDSRGSIPFDHHHHDPLLKRSFRNNSPSASKTLNSDGRSTRTDGSDEINSEESNSSDLGYAINRSSSNRNNNCQYRSDSKSSSHHQLFNKSSAKNKSAKISPKIIPDDGDQSNLFDSLAAELRAKLGNPKVGPLLLPPRDYESQNSESNLKSIMDKKRNQHDKHSNHPLSRSESSGKSNSSGLGSDEALCNDQQTTRPRSYYFDSCSIANESPRSSNHHRSSYLEHRYNRETSADDDLVSHHSDSSSSSSNDDVNVGGGVNHRGRLNNNGSIVDCLEVDVEDFEEDVIFSTTIPSIQKESKQSSRSRSKSTYNLMPTQQQQQLSSPTSFNDNDFDDIRTRQRLPSQHVQHQFHKQKHLIHPSSSPLTRTKEHNNNNNDEQTAANNLHHFGRGRDDHQHHYHHQQQQQHATLEILNPDFSPAPYNHHNSSSNSGNINRKKFYSNPNLEPISSSTMAIQQQQQKRSTTKEVNNNKIMRQQIINNEVDKSLNTTTTSGLISSTSSSSGVIGRREQRFNNPYHHRNEENNHHSRLANVKSRQPTQKFYFADAEFSSNFREVQHENNHRPSSSYNRGRSMGRLDQLLAVNSNENDRQNYHHQSDNYGPMSLNFQSFDNNHATIVADMNDRSISPPYYVLQHQQPPSLPPPPPPSSNIKKDLISKRYEKSSKEIVNENKRKQNHNQQQFKDHQRRMMFEQPFSRYSYIDMNDDRIEHERFSAMMIMNNRNKR
ncbi:hypothetical protein DERP_008618 [Dermatophagoides pteronyssinus]|uniref:GATA zinc finger domain-containing protein 14-like n=1 Tax=Dermatophagoides pteronyssinus TaxID=6956 RepID=A0ABQ8IX55_DERPT|nr:hypothetical protein DERP_008618 [Dermatophagoides pteronyssinus]